MSWDAFTKSVDEAQQLAQPEAFDFFHRLGEHYATLRRYVPELLAVLKLRAAPAAKDVLDAVDVIRDMNSGNARKVPLDAPTDFLSCYRAPFKGHFPGLVLSSVRRASRRLTM